MDRIPQAVTRRSCPGCDYIINQLMIDRARLDFDCPRCRSHTLRDFLPWPPKPKTPPKPIKRKAA
jgi:uncharacterized paraquat-inducible protein A